MAVGVAVSVRYFARLREQAGTETETVADVPAGSSVGDLYDTLRRSHPSLPEREGVRAAVNRDFADWDAELHPHDEIAFIPPVSGGCRDAL